MSITIGRAAGLATTSGPINGAPGETWSAVTSALGVGRRGFGGGSSLARLLAKYRGVRNHMDVPRLTVESNKFSAGPTITMPVQDAGRIAATARLSRRRVRIASWRITHPNSPRVSGIGVLFDVMLLVSIAITESSAAFPTVAIADRRRGGSFKGGPRERWERLQRRCSFRPPLEPERLILSGG